jgi:hypothetical protein
MSAHRFRALIGQLSATPVTTGVACAFVPCPCPLLNAFAPFHASYVREVYRLVLERMHTPPEPSRSRISQFSLN